jgi:hypothetical protein
MGKGKGGTLKSTGGSSSISSIWKKVIIVTSCVSFARVNAR